MSPIIVYLTDSYLQVVNVKGSSRFSFPPDSVRYHTIVDKEKFNKELSGILDAAKLSKDKAVIILGNKIVYTNKTEEKDEKKIRELSEQFFSYIPADPGKLAKFVLTIGEVTHFFAAEQTLYSTIVAILHRYSLEVEAVVPASVFGIETFDRELTQDDLKKITSKQSFIQKASFLKTGTHISTILRSDVAVKNNKIKPTLFLLISIIYIVVTVYSLLKTTYIYLSAKNSVSQKSIVVSPTIDRPIYRNKKELKIQVLDGLGNPSELEAAQKKLFEGGFVITSLGIVENLQLTKTITKAGKNVDKKIITEIRTLLGTVYTLSSEENDFGATDASNYDIVIILGKEKRN